MNVAPQLTAQEFKDLHNGLCEVRNVFRSMEGVVSQNLLGRAEDAWKLIEKALANAYAADEKIAAKRDSHYNEISDKNDFKTIWSVHEVSDLNAPFAGAATKLAYRDHWGASEVVVPINGNTWVDLWRAAEAAIKQSGDTHHVFIEAFIPSNVTGVLVLSTGSWRRLQSLL